MIYDSCGNNLKASVVCSRAVKRFHYISINSLELFEMKIMLDAELGVARFVGFD